MCFGQWGEGCGDGDPELQELDRGRKALECRALPGVIYPW